jgi:RNA polymerase sigma-70 factor (ECF subfamily)
MLHLPPPPDLSAPSAIVSPASESPADETRGSEHRDGLRHGLERRIGNGFRWFVTAVATAVVAAGVAHRRTLERITEGDQGALRELYDAFAGRALAVALRIVKQTAEAEDIVQEVFLDIWKRASQYTPDRGGVGSWIVAIARNRAIDRIRSVGSAHRVAGAAVSEVPTEPPLDPTTAVDDQRARDRVRAALQSLSPGQRKVIELAYFEGLSQSQIASQIGEPLGTIKSRMRAAMSKLADELGPPTGGGA